MRDVSRATGTNIQSRILLSSVCGSKDPLSHGVGGPIGLSKKRHLWPSICRRTGLAVPAWFSRKVLAGPSGRFSRLRRFGLPLCPADRQSAAKSNGAAQPGPAAHAWLHVPFLLYQDMAVESAVLGAIYIHGGLQNTIPIRTCKIPQRARG